MLEREFLPASEEAADHTARMQNETAAGERATCLICARGEVKNINPAAVKQPGNERYGPYLLSSTWPCT
jgi:hypothetical protein